MLPNFVVSFEGVVAVAVVVLTDVVVVVAIIVLTDVDVVVVVVSVVVLKVVDVVEFVVDNRVLQIHAPSGPSPQELQEFDTFDDLSANKKSPIKLYHYRK